MPSYRIADASISAPAFAVFGSYVSGSSKIVSHVGLIAEAVKLEPKEQIRVQVCEMRPPLHLGRSNLSEPTPIADVVGWLELSIDERDGIIDWIAGVKTRFSARMPPQGPTEPLSAFLSRTHYSLYPTFQRSRIDEVTGREIHEYFNCVGFVLACYEMGAGIRLLADPETEQVPLAGLPTIAKLYGAGHAAVVRRYSGALNLMGKGPWPILFGGYLFHALELDRADLPHSPRFIEMKY